MRLYGFFRSSATFRVRIALNLKNLEYEEVPVNLHGGEQHGDAYGAINPQRRVPTLIDGDMTLIQSIATIEYLEETHSAPPLLPADPVGRARVRGVAGIIACDIHPLNGIGTRGYLKDGLNVDEDGITAWYEHWVRLGFETLEALLAGHPATGAFCHGDAPGLADICLVPQVLSVQGPRLRHGPLPHARPDLRHLYGDRGVPGGPAAALAHFPAS